MGRGERRAKDREEAKRERSAKSLAAALSRKTAPPAQGANILETLEETARRIYRTGSKPERRGKTVRRGGDKPRKWREGRL